MPSEDERSEVLIRDNWGDEFIICPVVSEEKDGDIITTELRVEMHKENEDNVPCLWLSDEQFLVFAEKIKVRAEEIMFTALQIMGGVSD